MARPRIAEPKRVVTLRLHPALIARYEAMGGSWRARMEEALEAWRPGRAEVVDAAPAAKIKVVSPETAEPPKASAIPSSVPFGRIAPAFGSRLDKKR